MTNFGSWHKQTFHNFTNGKAEQNLYIVTELQKANQKQIFTFKQHNFAWEAWKNNSNVCFWYKDV